MDEHENSHAQDRDANIGLTLQNARQERGLTHEDVERDTKIRVRYLKAMEDNDYDALPGAVYAQGFLKTYANYLGLDGESLAQDLKDHQGGYGELPKEHTRESRRPPKSGSNPRRPDRPGRPRRRRVPVLVIVGGALALLVLAIVVSGLYFVGLQASRSSEDAANNPAGAEGSLAPENNDRQAAEDPPPEQEPVDNTPSGEPAQQGGGEQNPGAQGNNAGESQDPPPADPAPPAEPAPGNLTMQIRVEGNVSWLNIETDGNTAFSQVAESGFTRTFEAGESITVWSGNAGAVFVSVNGQDYGQLGESGQTIIREFNLKTAEN